MKQKEKDSLLQAIEQAKGFISVAAQIIGVDRSTIYDWMKRDPELKEAVQTAIHAARERTVDFAENKLFKLMESKNERVCLDAIRYYLNNQARHRGYSLHRLENDNGKPISDADKLSDDELDMSIEKNLELLGFVRKDKYASTADTDNAGK